MRPKIFSSDTGENPCDLGLGKDFLDKLDKSLKEWSIQEKLMKFKTLFFERYCNGIKAKAQIGKKYHSAIMTKSITDIHNNMKEFQNNCAEWNL